MKQGVYLKLVMSTLIISSISFFASGQANWTVKNTSNSPLSNNIVTELFQTSSGETWVGTANGVNRIVGEDWQKYSRSDGLPHKMIVDIGEDKSGKIWVATLKGIAIFDGQNITQITKKEGIAHNKVYAVETDSKGNVWVGTKKGLSVFNGSDWKTYGTTDGLINNWVLDIMEDENGTIWVATKLGLSKFDGTDWTSYSKTDGLVRNFVWSLSNDGKGKVWIGTHTGGFNTFDGTNWETFKKGSGYYNTGALIGGVLNFVVWSLVISPVLGGVFLVAGAIAGAFPTPAFATCVLVDSKANVWLSAQPKGVFMFDGQNWMQYDNTNGLPHKKVYDLMESTEGDMWFGTHKGIAILQKS